MSECTDYTCTCDVRHGLDAHRNGEDVTGKRRRRRVKRCQADEDESGEHCQSLLPMRTSGDVVMFAPRGATGGLPCVPPIKTSCDVVIVLPVEAVGGVPAAPPINTRPDVVMVAAGGVEGGAGGGAGAGAGCAGAGAGAGFGFGFDDGSRGDSTGVFPGIGSVPGSVITPMIAAALARVLSAPAISFIPSANADAVNEIAVPSPLYDAATVSAPPGFSATSFEKNGFSPRTAIVTRTLTTEAGTDSTGSLRVTRASTIPLEYFGVEMPMSTDVCAFCADTADAVISISSGKEGASLRMLSSYAALSRIAWDR